MPDNTATGTLTAVGQTVEVVTDDMASVGINLTGTYTGGSVAFEVLIGATWRQLVCYYVQAEISVTQNGTPGLYIGGCAGYAKARARCLAIASGAINVDLRAGAGAPGYVNTAIDTELPSQVGMSDALFPSNTTYVGALSMFYDQGSGAWKRVRGDLVSGLYVKVTGQDTVIALLTDIKALLVQIRDKP